MKRIHIISIAVALVGIVAVILVLRISTGKNDDRITIGVVLPLTGRAADQGKDILSGIEMACDEINAALKPDEPWLELAIEDDLSSAQGGVSALQKLIQTKHPPAVIGPIASSIMLAMVPVAERERVVLLSPAASSPKISNAGQYIFRISLLAPPQARALAEYSRDKLKAETTAILFSNDDTGHSYRDAFRSEFTKRGGKVVLEESFNRAATDFRAQITKLKASKPDVTFVPGIPQAIGLILKQAKELGVKTQFLGNYGAEGANLLTSAGDTAEDFIYTSIPISVDFVQAFLSRVGHHPTIGAPLGYDALNIVWHVARKEGASAEDIRRGLAGLHSYEGATGNTTILPSGDAEKSVQLKTIRNGSFVPLEDLQVK